MAEPEERAEELLRLTQKAAGRLVEGITSLGLLTAEEAEASRTVAREQARYLFLFVVLSVLLENRPGQDPADRLVAEELKALFARQLAEDRKQAAALLAKALKPGRAELLRRKLSSSEDPFAPYYESFQKARANPEHGPFAILARRLAQEHFPSDQRPLAYERIVTLSALISDELVEGL